MDSPHFFRLSINFFEKAKVPLSPSCYSDRDPLSSKLFFKPSEVSRKYGFALWAGAVFRQVIFVDLVPVAHDERGVARGAKRGAATDVMYVAGIDMV
jgi:hypothetical protein